MFKFRIMMIILSFCILTSCSLLGMLTSPSVEKEKKDRFLSATGHEMLSIFAKEDSGLIYKGEGKGETTTGVVRLLEKYKRNGGSK